MRPHRLLGAETLHLSLPSTSRYVFELPKPPSANGLFGAAPNAEQKRYIAKKYHKWRYRADQELLAQGPLRAVRGPVCVTVTISDSGSGDLDNRLKAILDFCVRHGIIPDDNRETVREIHMQWGDCEGARVEITEASDWTARNIKQREVA